MAEEEIIVLRDKLDKQDLQFQNYREECKVLQNFLEEESQKKEQQIRKLKEDAIIKDKSHKLMKTQNGQLLSQVTSLQDEILSLNQRIQTLNQQISAKNQDPRQDPQKVKGLEETISNQSAQNQQLAKKLSKLQSQFLASQQINEQLKRQMEQKQCKNSQLHIQLSKWQKDLDERKRQNENLLTEKEQLESKLNSIISKKIQSPTKKTVKKEDMSRQKELERELLKAEDKIKRYESKLQKMDLIIKQLRQQLSHQSKASLSAQKPKQQPEASGISKVYVGGIISTKPYYISPFLEVVDDKTIKIFKASRNGCFEKSLGAIKHRLDNIAHDQSVIVKDVVSRIISFEEDYPHFVLIYGSQKTSKRTVMATLIHELLEYLKQKIQNGSKDISAIYISKTAEEDKIDEHIEAFSTEDSLSLLQKIVVPHSPKKGEKIIGSKRTQPPRISYFSLRVDNFCLQIATSSYTNIPVRQKDSLSDFYNNVLFSKLPDILQNSYGQKYLILTIHPIVDLYDDCKNILSATLYRVLLSQSSKNEDGKEIDFNKEMLNSLARKRVQHYERQMENNVIKIRKVEDQCYFYKLKLEELAERLKNLISTHHGQSSYLKKSPILLSYQKMLKFVTSVQGKYSNLQSNFNPGMQVININDLDFESDLSLEAL